MPRLSDIIGGVGRRIGAMDYELVLSVLRIGIVSLTAIYLVVQQFGADTSVSSLTVNAALAFLLASLAIFAWVTSGPAQQPLRRAAGIVHDMAALSLAMYTFAAAAPALYVVMLLLIFASGSRFGVRYLALASVLATAGMAAMLGVDPDGPRYAWPGYGLLAGLVVLPAFVAVLIRRLGAARNRAAQADRTKARFLATMSHELRTPLNGVIGMADLLRTTPLNPEQEEHARTISVSANTLLALIDEMLDISRIDAGRLSIEAVDFDLHRLVGNTTKMMAAPAGQKCLHISARVSPEIPYALNGSERHLQQVLVNLLGNAIKFTDEGHVELNVSLARTDAEGRTVWVRFEVIDTGIGIPAEMQGRIFERFTQLDGSSTRRHDGAGLGITISKRLVEIMGGEIGVDSEPGQGSTFWMELPLRRVPAGAEEQAEQPSLSDSRVLVVTGNHAESRRVMTLLSGWGVAAQQRDVAAQAIAELVNAAHQGMPYNTVVVDNRGSRSDPVQLLQTAKQDDLLKSLAFVLISPPLADPDWRQRFLDMGFAAVLPTPFDKTLLFNALHSVCAGSVEDPQVAQFIDHYARERRVLPPLEILVAEDNRVNQTVVRGILEKAGHRVYLVENGEQALDALDTHRFDIALFDIQMPRMDGIEALKIYRFTHSNDDAIPIVMLSADVTAEIRNECDEAGAAAFIAKPIQARTLLESIGKVLETGRRGGADTGMEEADMNALASGEMPAPVPTSQVIDTGTLRELEELGGDLQFVDSLIDSFVRDTEGLFEQFGKAIATRGTRQFRDLVHALKGSAGSVGASRLHELASLACRISDRDFARVAPTAVSQMRSAFAEARTALHAYIRERRELISRN